MTLLFIVVTLCCSLLVQAEPFCTAHGASGECMSLSECQTKARHQTGSSSSQDFFASKKLANGDRPVTGCEDEPQEIKCCVIRSNNNPPTPNPTPDVPTAAPTPGVPSGNNGADSSIEGKSCRAYGYDGACTTSCNDNDSTHWSSTKVNNERIVTGCEKDPNPAAKCCVKSGPITAPGAATTSIAGVGDSVFGIEQLRPKPDQNVLSSEIRQIMAAADATFINLETACCEESVRVQKKPCSGNCYAFRMPVSRLDELTGSGVDLVSIANNHALDFGESCRANLETLLDNIDMAWSGRPGTIGHYTTPKGVKVALVAFHTHPGSNFLLQSLSKSKQLVSEAKASADLVVVSFHGGAEGASAIHVPDREENYYGNRGHLRRFAHAMVDAGADVIYGHGPHVLRGMELYKNKFIVYSLGNFATYGTFNLNGVNGQGAIVTAHVDAQGNFHHADVVGTRQRRDRNHPDGDRVVGPYLDEGAFEQFKMLSEEDFAASALYFDADSNTVWHPRASGAPAAAANFVAFRESNDKILEASASATSLTIASLLVAVLAFAL